jgi:hypothetical protein
MSNADASAVHPHIATLQSILQPIDRAPRLMRINGIGTTLLGALRYPWLEPHFVAVHFFTVLFIPLFPLGFYLVKPADGRAYYFIGKISHANLAAFVGVEGMRRLWLSLLREFSVWLGLFVIGVIVAVVVSG